MSESNNISYIPQDRINNLDETLLEIIEHINTIQQEITEEINTRIEDLEEHVERLQTETIQEINASLALKTDDTTAVHKTGNETINGVKTFTQTIQGTALNALWGDLAEFYESDNEYPKGTLVQFGGEKEITIAIDEVNAVITSQPGVLLNGCMENGQAVALVGRVPVRTIGKVNKFDYLTLSEIPGVAKVLEDDEYSMTNVIARALEDKDSEEESLVLCVVKFSI